MKDARRLQLSTVEGYKAWKANPEPPCMDCGGGKGLGHTPDCTVVASDRHERRHGADDNHEPACCGGCEVCFAVCSGYHGPERRAVAGDRDDEDADDIVDSDRRLAPKGLR